MLIDSSAWIEYLRGTKSDHDLAVRDAIAAGNAHTTDAIRLELLCGVVNPQHLSHVKTLLDGCDELEQIGRVDIDSAGSIYRACRRNGETIRRANDCLIAAVAIRSDVPVLHRDADFDAIARNSALRMVRV